MDLSTVCNKASNILQEKQTTVARKTRSLCRETSKKRKFVSDPDSHRYHYAPQSLDPDSTLNSDPDPQGDFKLDPDQQ